MNNMSISTRGLLRYPGGKTRAVSTLAQLLPEERYNTVISPFFGGGSFELYLTSLGKEVTGYDVFSPLVSFWQHVLMQPERLSEHICPHIGKVNREDFHVMQEALRNGETSDMEEAVMFFILNRCSFSGATLSGGYSKQAAEKRFTTSSVDRVRNFHNPYITIHKGDVFDVLDNPGCDFLFLDPPYLLDDSFLYGNKGDIHKNFNHDLLAEKLHSISRPFLMTYNDNDKVRSLYKGYDIIPAEWSYGMNKSKKSSEIIIRNYRGSSKDHVI